MSQTPKRLSPSAAATRKRLERARRRAGGYAECLIRQTLATRDLIAGYAQRLDMPYIEVASLVHECAAPRYLREVSRRLDQIKPLFEQLRQFQRHGVEPRPGPLGVNAARFKGSGGTWVELDPAKCYQTVTETTALLAELAGLGVTRAMVEHLVPLHGIRPRRKRSSQTTANASTSTKATTVATPPPAPGANPR